MTIQEIIARLQETDLLGAIIILICFILIGEIVKILIKTVARRLAAKTKTNIDDEMLHATEKPIFWGITLAGIFMSLLSVRALDAYKTLILKAASIVGILWGAWTIMRVLRALLNWYGTEMAGKTSTDLDDKYLHIFQRVFNIVIWILVGLLVLQQMGISITPLLASLGIAGLAVGLALQDTLANFFSGFYIISERVIKIGNFVELENGAVQGYVEDIGWRTSRIKTLANNLVIIPNSRFAQATVINYDAPSLDQSLAVPASVSYDSDLDKVEKVTIEVAKSVMKEIQGGVKDFEPMIRYTKLGQSSIDFNVVMRITDPVSQYIVKHEFISRLVKRYRKEKIVIPYPITTVHLKR
jgi:small-conductance mechanosensitive channel